MQTPISNSAFHRGFTLIEAMVTLAVAGVLLCIVIPSFQGLIEGRHLESDATQLAADVQTARSEAIARKTPVRITFRSTAAESCYMLHVGPLADCTCASAPDAAECHRADVQVVKTVRWPAAERVRLDANVESLLFDPLHGTATPAATLKVLGLGGRAVHLVVNVMGRVRSCSPWSLVAGHSRC